MLVLVMLLTSGQACECKEIKLTDTLSPSPSPILYKACPIVGLRSLHPIPLGNLLSTTIKTNKTDKSIQVIASYNVTPQKAGIYFNKLDCFCYEERKVLAGQKIVLPVTFFISPEIIDDPNTSELKSLTLSYTFFNVNNINVSNLY